MRFQTHCSCGNISVGLILPKPIESYRPRQCDCDFCMSNNIQYLSDSNGSLSIKPTTQLNQLRQGSEQAVFWQCSNCHQIVAVSHQYENEFRGALNAQLFSHEHQLPEAVVVSPKSLSPSEKRERWSSVWLHFHLDE